MTPVRVASARARWRLPPSRSCRRAWAGRRRHRPRRRATVRPHPTPSPRRRTWTPPRSPPLAHQARGLPHQGEPQLRRPVRPVPRCRRRHQRERPRHDPAPHPRRGPTSDGGRPALLQLPAARGERWPDGRVQHRPRSRPGGLHARCRPNRSPPYWAWAERNVLSDRFFASAWDRRSPTTCTRSRRPRAARSTTRAPPRPRRAEPAARAGLREVVGVRHRGRRLRRGLRRRGRAHRGLALLRLPDRGRPAEPQAHPVGLLRGDEPSERLHLSGLLGDPPLPRTTRRCGRASSGRSTT